MTDPAPPPAAFFMKVDPAERPLLARALKEGRMLFLFGAVGAAGFLVDALLLKLGLSLGLSKALARLISIAATMHFTFFVNRQFVFNKVRGRDGPWRQYFMYLAANSFGAVVNYGVFLLLAHNGGPLDHAPILAVAAGSIAGMAVNFAGSRLLAFRG